MIKPRYQVSEAGLELIMSFEGYRASAAQLADGRWTIGYGHTKSARAGAQVSRADAKILLLYDLTEINLALQELIFTPLNQNQVDALASFSFNIGLPSFRQSVVLRRVNEGSLLEAACEIDLWRRAELQGEDIVVDALVRRRAAEKALFLTPVAGWSVAPTAVVQPRLDADVHGGVPRSRPMEIHAPLDGEQATAEVVRPLDTPHALVAHDTSDQTALAEIEAEAHAPEQHPVAGAELVAPELFAEEAVASPSAPESQPVSNHVVATTHMVESSPFVSAALAETVADDVVIAPFPQSPAVTEGAAVEALVWTEAEHFEPAHNAATTTPAVANHAEPEPEPTAPASSSVENQLAAALRTLAAQSVAAPETAAEDLSDLIPRSFRPVPVAHASLSGAPVAPAFDPDAPVPSAKAPVTGGEPSGYAGPPGWTPESFRRPLLFPSLDQSPDLSRNLRTPAAARIAGFQVATAEPESDEMTPFLLLGLFGLVVFAGSVFWTITARQSGSMASPLVLGGAVALAGIGCVVASVYFLVHRFLGRDA